MRYFVVSDIHSCHDELFSALLEAGYDSSRDDQILIVCGDIFDRGPKPIETFRALREIPRERRILIKGNHEDLLVRALESGDLTAADLQNGTIETMQIFSRREERILDGLALRFAIEENYDLLEWLEGDQWQDCFEIGPYLFVHAGFPTMAMTEEGITEDFSWRHPQEGVAPDWKSARWENPLLFSKSRFFQREKERGTILVAGHRPNDRYWKEKGKQDIFFDDHFIGMDGGCHYSGQMNVLVIDDSDWKAIPFHYRKERTR